MQYGSGNGDLLSVPSLVTPSASSCRFGPRVCAVGRLGCRWLDQLGPLSVRAARRADDAPLDTTEATWRVRPALCTACMCSHVSFADGVSGHCVLGPTSRICPRHPAPAADPDHDRGTGLDDVVD